MQTLHKLFVVLAVLVVFLVGLFVGRATMPDRPGRVVAFDVECAQVEKPSSVVINTITEVVYVDRVWEVVPAWCMTTVEEVISADVTPTNVARIITEEVEVTPTLTTITRTPVPTSIIPTFDPSTTPVISTPTPEPTVVVTETPAPTEGPTVQPTNTPVTPTPEPDPTEEECDRANPGNIKCVGRAGETPSNGGDRPWNEPPDGEGTRGRSSEDEGEKNENKQAPVVVEVILERKGNE